MTKVSVANTHYKSSYSCWYLIEWCNDIGLNCRLQPVQRSHCKSTRNWYFHCRCFFKGSYFVAVLVIVATQPESSFWV